MTTNIADAISQAKAAAATMPQTQLPVQAPATTPPVGFAKPSMAMVAASTGVIPRATPYLKVNEFGILIGKAKKPFLEGFKAKVLLIEDQGFQLKWTIRYGNPAQYLSTFDGNVCDKGGTWHDALTKARMIDPQAEPYTSVDVRIELDEDIKMGDETFLAGSLVGFNSSKTNFSEWSDFYAQCAADGLVGTTVDVQVGHRAIEYNRNTWGVVTFSPR